MSWIVLRLEVDGTNVLQIGPLRLSVDRTFVQFRIFSCGRVYGVDVYDRHLLVENFRLAFDQFAASSVQTGALEEQSVDVYALSRTFLDVFSVVARY